MKSVVLTRPVALVMCSVALLSACSKGSDPEVASAHTEAEVKKDAPTGLVKNAVKHGETADVTRWMDMAGTKSAAQVAREEKAAKEALAAKEAQALKDAQAAKEAKLAQERAQAAKVAANTRSQTIAPAAVAKPIEVPAPAPVIAAAKPVVAATAPAAAAPAAATENTSLRLVSSVKPKFPNTALRAGVSQGTVSARLHVEADGRVSAVDIVKATPPRQFDREVVAAATQWKYAPMSKAQTTVVEFAFKAEE